MPLSRSNSSTASTANPLESTTPCSTPMPAPDTEADEDTRLRGLIWLPNGEGRGGFLILTSLHHGFVVELPGRGLASLLELQRLRALGRSKGLCEVLLGWISLKDLAAAAARATEARTGQLCSPVSESTARRYIRDLLRDVAAIAASLGVDWDSEQLIEHRTGIALRLLADLEVHIGPL